MLAKDSPETRRKALEHTLELNKPSNFKATNQHILKVGIFNKETAFSRDERNHYQIRGLIPPVVETLDQQLKRTLHQLEGQPTAIERYVFLQLLASRNITLFYKLLEEHLEEIMPIVYTPTVGEACLKFSHIFRLAQGMYLSGFTDQGSLRKILDNWPSDEVSIIVVSDGSRILGLGDLGVNGMGIPIGKLSLYVAAAGFNPAATLPVILDLGTNNEQYLKDEYYLGEKSKRLTGVEYLARLDEFVTAVFDKWPNVLLQFEDFSTENAFMLLERYRYSYRVFNDDIQGTGAVVLSGFINALKIQNCKLKDTKIVFYGAGSAGVGVADTIVKYFVQEGHSEEEARTHFWFVDSKGLITHNREDRGSYLQHKIPYARKDNGDVQLKDLLEIVKYVKPNALIGLAGTGPAFTEQIFKELCDYSERPIVFALSNPTSKSECSAEEAYKWSDGKAVFASGSPFDPVNLNGKTYYPGQGNNMYIFPGLGFGTWLGACQMVSDGMVAAAASALAAEVPEENLRQGDVYPSIKNIRKISAKVAASVIQQAFKEGICGLARLPDVNLADWVENQMWKAKYAD